MKSKMFSVRDSKIGTFTQPFFSQTVGAALRSLEAAVYDTNHDFCKWAKDFDLYHIGEYDAETGTVIPLAQPQHIASCLDFKNQKSLDNLTEDSLQSRN